LYEVHKTVLETTHEAVAIFDHQDCLILQNRKFAETFHGQPQFMQMEQANARLEWTDEMPSHDENCRTGEAHVGKELFSVRQVPFPPTTLAPRGGTIWMLSSLQAREERDRSRAEVLGFITHELRTPLTAIQGFAELMMQFPNSPQNARAPETMFRESKRLLALIHSYLDVLRIDAGARLPLLEEIDVEQLVGHVFGVMRPIATASGMSLAWRGHRATLFGDAALLNGAVLNVVSNAIKYGERHSEIQVSCVQEGDEVKISVQNLGPPIEERDLPNLFSSYYRGAAAGERASGWGLGLAFVKRIAEKHGGRVTVESGGDGTTFCIHIPGAMPAAAVRSEP
jgi:two-component system, OmpR family, sensor histidine kinase SenX3